MEGAQKGIIQKSFQKLCMLTSSRAPMTWKSYVSSTVLNTRFLLLVLKACFGCLKFSKNNHKDKVESATEYIVSSIRIV